MRWIFLSLLLMNLGYFAWYNFVATPPRAAPVPVRRSAGTEIVLLEELAQAPARQFAEVVTNPIVQAEVVEDDASETAEVPATCTSIGPFPDLFAGWQTVDQLAALGITAEVKAVDQATGRHDYRVLLPPLPSLQEAFRKLRELKSRNIDSYVITEGQNALGISLGVFSAEERATRTRERLEKDGYQVEVVEIPRFHREYWIFPVAQREFALDAAVWEQLKSRGEPGAPTELRCQ